MTIGTPHRRLLAAAIPLVLAGALLPAGLGAVSATGAQPASASNDRAGVRTDLKAPARGERAIRALRREAGSRRQGQRTERQQPRAHPPHDSTAWITRDGRLFYKDEIGAESRVAAPTKAPFPDAQTFTLHSKPGSQRTLYIDFNGYTVPNSNVWLDNGLTVQQIEGFSLDASSSFNAAEHTLIQSVWQRVSEDYAPFDVDVTTEAPAPAKITRSNAGDQEYGTVAVVTNSVQAHEEICGDPSCTGIAFLDVFDEANGHDDLQPAWAFSAYFDDFVSIAETVTHEVGHNFGLNHDGGPGEDYYTGHGIWGPIMGSPVKPVIQWSKGDYTGATEKQDDVATIAGNGAPYRTDEAGDTVGSAATFTTAMGVISKRTDADVYSLGTCTGPVSVAGKTAYLNPNLDIELKLLDASGAALATANPVSANSTNGEAIRDERHRQPRQRERSTVRGCRRGRKRHGQHRVRRLRLDRVVPADAHGLVWRLADSHPDPDARPHRRPPRHRPRHPPRRPSPRRRRASRSSDRPAPASAAGRSPR